MKEEGMVKKIDKIGNNKILFKVKDGNKKLREESIEIENNFRKKVIVLDDVPLITVSEESSPMSSTVIKVMRGRSAVDNSIKEKININKSIKNVDEGFEKIKPVLRFLDDGDYELTELEMIPTDGEDNYFWNSGMYEHYYNASADVYYRGNYIKGFSKFLVPCEGVDCIDMNRVEYYRNRIRSGEKPVGIALELRGFMALLLDGHHKATAAYLEGKSLKCLTIKSYHNNSKVCNISKDKYEKYKVQNTNYTSIKIDEPKEVFPDFKAIAAVRKPMDVSREKINTLFKFQNNHPIEELENIIYYLAIYDKQKAKKLCFEILEKNEFQIMWGICLKYLSKYKDEYVQKKFRSMLSSNTIKYSFNYWNNMDIINRYFNSSIN